LLAFGGGDFSGVGRTRAHERPIHVREQGQLRVRQLGHRGVVGGVDRDRVLQCLDPDALLTQVEHPTTDTTSPC
jgi:hypothetical protein